MKKRIYLLALLLFCFYSQGLFSQKTSRKEIRNEDITSVQILTDKCYQLQISTHRSKEVVVVASIEGEYQDNLIITFQEEVNTLIVAASFQPIFNVPNDKLSAHKVISIGLEVILPENIDIVVSGTNTSVMANGMFQKLSISLADGSCVLSNAYGVIAVKTHSGTVRYLSDKTDVNASSKYGVVYRNEENNVLSKIILTSIKGDVFVKKQKGK